jgi:hypothetical protein
LNLDLSQSTYLGPGKSTANLQLFDLTPESHDVSYNGNAKSWLSTLHGDKNTVGRCRIAIAGRILYEKSFATQ